MVVAVNLAKIVKQQQQCWIANGRIMLRYIVRPFVFRKLSFHNEHHESRSCIRL